MKRQLLIIASLGAVTGLPLFAQDMSSDTTTTTTVAQPAPIEQQETTVTSRPVVTVGTVSTFGDGAMVIRTHEDAPPIRYTFSKTTRYVDADGNTISASYVKTGVPISVEYTRVGDQLIASKVIVKRVVHHHEDSDAEVEHQATVTDTDTETAPAPAPPVVTKKTTTTTTTSSNGN
ncbi:MAG: hypothetical protein QM796_22890 [Chthoniobacteraceae bacterium]